MLNHFDVIVLFILGGLFIDPRRYRNVYRAMGAAVLCGAATAVAYLLVFLPLLAWAGRFL
ncbi:hypothetical protein ABZ379_48780 [Streptomyces canus]|uniref:hypothetical protein n=1 Tax=Streptomyces canus TaxID=58343 RepID=UPI0033F86616